jgi:proteasome lid subunit RPN8/RPN11
VGAEVTIQISETLLAQIQANGAKAYPQEGAGFLFGSDETHRIVKAIFTLTNSREADARHNRYLITAENYLMAELEADRQGMTVIGVFHSHPDHPDLPSEFDREWAQPFFSYVITSVESGEARGSRSWRLVEDRSRFAEEKIQIIK